MSTSQITNVKLLHRDWVELLQDLEDLGIFSPLLDEISEQVNSPLLEGKGLVVGANDLHDPAVAQADDRADGPVAHSRSVSGTDGVVARGLGLGQAGDGAAKGDLVSRHDKECRKVDRP